MLFLPVTVVSSKAKKGIALPLVVICQKVCGKCICTISERKFCKNQYSQKTHTVVRFCIKNSCIACVFVSKHTCVAIHCKLTNGLTETASVQTLKENIAKTPKFTKDAHGSVFLCQNTLFASKNSLCLRLFFCDLQLPCIICLTVFVLFSVPSVYFFTHLFTLSKLYVAFCLRVF